MFINARTAEIVLAVIALMLGYRMVGRVLTPRQGIATAVAAVIGGVVFGAVVVLPLLSRLSLRYLLPEFVPWLLLAGIATGFLVAVGLGATRLVGRIAHS